MSIDFVHSIEIDRPAEEVFAFVSDFSKNPTWQKGMKRCAWTTEERGVGATYVQVAHFLGKQIDTRFRVTEHVPFERISIESIQSTIPLQITRMVEPLGEGRCRVSAHIRGQPKGLMKLAGGMVKMSVRRDYEALKRLLESA